MRANGPVTLNAFWSRISPAWKFSLVSVTLLRIFYTVWSLIFLSSFSLVVQNQDLFGESIVTAFHLESSRGYVYHRMIDNELLTFRALNGTHMIDLQTGSLWQITDGVSISGPNQGKRLLPAQRTSEDLFPYHRVAAYPAPLLAIWQRFDVNWYLSIAQRGYGSIPGDVHFPPLYPILIRLLFLMFKNHFISALLISQISLYIVVKLLYDLFAEWGTNRLAEKALFFLLIFPTSFFFFSAYSEATFMVLTILCLQAVRAGKWHWAGFWIFCAVLMRLQGVALLIPFGWSLLQTRLKGISTGQLLVTVISPLAAIAVYLLLRAASGDASVIPITETNLHARIVPPWENIIYSIRYIAEGAGGHIDILNLAALIGFGILILVYWRTFPIEYSLFSLASLVLLTMRLVDTQPLNSMIRYVITIFPVFYLFGSLAENKWVNLLMFPCFLSLNLFLTAQFFLWGWVA